VKLLKAKAMIAVRLVLDPEALPRPCPLLSLKTAVDPDAFELSIRRRSGMEGITVILSLINSS